MVLAEAELHEAVGTWICPHTEGWPLTAGTGRSGSEPPFRSRYTSGMRSTQMRPGFARIQRYPSGGPLTSE